ncbi:AEC family transporter [Klebsiella variicola subsp. variicola]|nr:AEC family transporter [Klebsiella variicola subsp. variicola]
MVDNKNVSLLNIFVMDFALPATLFSATVQTPWAGIVASVAAGAGADRRDVDHLCRDLTSSPPACSNARRRMPAVLTLTVALPNYAALGLPILGSVLGEGASTSLSVAVSFACGSVLMTPFCLLILEREKARAAGENSGSTLAMLPVLMRRFGEKTDRLGPAAWGGASAIGIKMPEMLLASIKPLAWPPPPPRCSSPGVILSARKLQLNALIATSTIVKLLVQPFIAWALVMLRRSARFHCHYPRS